jgi:hypothetical protein
LDRIGTGLGHNWDRIGAGLGQDSDRVWDRIRTRFGQGWDRIGTGFAQGLDTIGKGLWGRIQTGFGQDWDRVSYIHRYMVMEKLEMQQASATTTMLQLAAQFTGLEVPTRHTRPQSYYPRKVVKRCAR